MGKLSLLPYPETLFETLYSLLQPSITDTNWFSKQMHWENKKPARSDIAPAKK